MRVFCRRRAEERGMRHDHPGGGGRRIRRIAMSMTTWPPWWRRTESALPPDGDFLPSGRGHRRVGGPICARSPDISCAWGSKYSTDAWSGWKPRPIASIWIRGKPEVRPVTDRNGAGFCALTHPGEGPQRERQRAGFRGSTESAVRGCSPDRRYDPGSHGSHRCTARAHSG